MQQSYLQRQFQVMEMKTATVNDVLNAGWNLKTNGNQAAAITNGKGLDFASDDNSVTITPTWIKMVMRKLTSL